MLSDVSLSVAGGDALGLVGRSGSGKSTIVKCMLRLIRPDDGRITYDGIDVTNAEELRSSGSAARCNWCSRTPTAASTRA